MTEKRFIISKNVGNRFPTGIIDTKEQHLLWVEQVVDCLNEQQATITALKEENEQLRRECKSNEHLCEYYRQKYKKLLEDVQENVKGELVIR